VLGIFLDSFIAAKASREFRFRMPDAKTGIRSFLGGIFDGIRRQCRRWLFDRQRPRQNGNDDMAGLVGTAVYDIWRMDGFLFHVYPSANKAPKNRGEKAVPIA
jgi:hypothetical protein